jgi:hypothetical protein
VRAVTHPLIRDVYVSILRDEARHRRFGSLYFEWADERLDERERARLGAVALSALQDYAPFWRIDTRCSQELQRRTDQADADPRADAAHELGWLEPARYVPIAISVVRDQILPSLRALELPLPEAELAALLEPERSAGTGEAN